MGRELNKHSTCTYQKRCGCVFYSVEKVVFRKMFQFLLQLLLLMFSCLLVCVCVCVREKCVHVFVCKLQFGFRKRGKIVFTSLMMFESSLCYMLCCRSSSRFNSLFMHYTQLHTQLIYVANYILICYILVFVFRNFFSQ